MSAQPCDINAAIRDVNAERDRERRETELRRARLSHRDAKARQLLEIGGLPAHDRRAELPGWVVPATFVAMVGSVGFVVVDMPLVFLAVAFGTFALFGVERLYEPYRAQQRRNVDMVGQLVEAGCPDDAIVELVVRARAGDADLHATAARVLTQARGSR